MIDVSLLCSGDDNALEIMFCYVNLIIYFAVETSFPINCKVIPIHI